MRYCRSLLADGHVDANHVFALLVDDRIERDGGLAGLAVADYQLALAAPDWYHRVDRLEAGLQRLFHLAVDDARRDALDRHVLFGNDRALPSAGWPSALTTRPIMVAGRHLDDSLGAFDDVAFLDRLKLAEQDRADLVLFEVERESGRALLEFQQFPAITFSRP